MNADLDLGSRDRALALVLVLLVNPLLESYYERVLLVNSLVTCKTVIFVDPISDARKTRGLCDSNACRAVEKLLCE